MFQKPKGVYFTPLQVPCGQCIGCRLERSRQWAVRCLHESQCYDENCFVTLTYDNAHLPAGNTLVLSDLQKFLKRFRKITSYKKIKFYACGEYGDQYGRPHYHLAIFGHDFDDKILYKKTRNGDSLYTSEILKSVWQLGSHQIGALTFSSAAYIARYVMKKMTGRKAAQHYEFVDPQTGEIFDRLPEFNTMSRRGGIGSTWLKKFNTDVYSGDFVIVNGKKCRPPRFYDGQYEILDPSDMRRVKLARISNARRHADNNTPERLVVRETVLKARIKTLKREIE